MCCSVLKTNVKVLTLEKGRKEVCCRMCWKGTQRRYAWKRTESVWFWSLCFFMVRLFAWHGRLWFKLVLKVCRFFELGSVNLKTISLVFSRSEAVFALFAWISPSRTSTLRSFDHRESVWSVKLRAVKKERLGETGGYYHFCEKYWLIVSRRRVLYLSVLAHALLWFLAENVSLEGF